MQAINTNTADAKETTPSLLLSPAAVVNSNDKELDNHNIDQNWEDEEERKIWVRTVASLALTLLVQSYLLVSVFPYSGFMAMHLVPGLT